MRSAKTLTPVAFSLAMFFVIFTLVVMPAYALDPRKSGPGSVLDSPSGQSVSLENPLGAGNSNLAVFLSKLLQSLTFIGLPFAALFLLWAGFQFVAARGNTEKLETARRNLLYIVIGIAIFVAAAVIAQVIGNTIQQLR